MMKIGVILICAFISLAFDVSKAQDTDPLSPVLDLKEPEMSERSIANFLKAVTHEKLAGDRHVYKIRGVLPLAKDSDGEMEAETIKDFMIYPLPEEWKVEVDWKELAIVIESPREIPNDKLAWNVELARRSSLLLVWDELEARNLQRSPDFDASLFEIKEVASELPEGLAWFGVGDSKVTSTFRSGLHDEYDSLLVTGTTWHCKCQMNYAIRILDSKGEVIWEAIDPKPGSARVAIGDSNKDGLHEVYLKLYDHGKESQLVIRRAESFEGASEAKGAEKAEEKSKSKSEEKSESR